MADTFVSYTKSDRDWAFWLAEELKELGYARHIHEWEINTGDDIYAWMEARHDAAGHTLCVVSDDYLKDPPNTSTTSPSCFGCRANSLRRGRSSSARWRSARGHSAPTIPTPRPYGTISPR
jgi:hypothetical protein